MVEMKGECTVDKYGDCLNSEYLKCEDCNPIIDRTNKVEHPDHYTRGGIECIDAIEAATTGLKPFEAYCIGNSIKYLWRWKWKNGTEDLQKAKRYIDILLDKINK